MSLRFHIPLLGRVSFPEERFSAGRYTFRRTSTGEFSWLRESDCDDCTHREQPPAEWLAETDVEGMTAGEGDDAWNEKMRRELDVLLCILRTFRPGRISVPAIWCHNHYYECSFYTAWSSSGTEPEYTAATEEFDNFKRHVADLSSMDPNQYGLRRFAHYYFFPMYVDRLVSLAIALDNLLFPEENSGAVQTGIRGCFTYSQMGVADPRIHEEFMTFYNWRNRLVHRDETAVPASKFIGVADDMECRCRDIIRFFWRQGLLADSAMRKAFLPSLRTSCQPCPYCGGSLDNSVNRNAVYAA